MWSPGVAALATRLALQRNVRGEGWRWGRTRWQVLSYAIPLVYALVAYGAVWALGLGSVRWDVLASRARTLPVFATAGALASCASALGEELGWRGLLVPELAKLTTFTGVSLVSGGVWTLWHMPVIFFADYNSGTPPLYAAACFTVLVLGISFLFAWMRLKSGSVFTGMLLHASHNLWIQGFFDAITGDTGKTRWFTGEFGAALAVAGAAVGFLFWTLRGRLPEPGAKA
jgi:membrane protease YdiL (CAAX protease family)